MQLTVGRKYPQSQTKCMAFPNTRMITVTVQKQLSPRIQEKYRVIDTRVVHMQNPRKFTDNPYLSHTDNHVYINMNQCYR